jgi:Kef-type K+ transport system membrane component KefB
MVSHQIFQFEDVIATFFSYVIYYLLNYLSFRTEKESLPFSNTLILMLVVVTVTHLANVLGVESY